MKIKKIKFYDIDFHNLTNFNDLEIHFKRGIFACFPSGPGLATLRNDHLYKKSLKNAEFNFFDSGLFVLLLRLFNFKVSKYSGFKFISEVLAYFKHENINNFFFVDPSLEISKKNMNLLKKNFIRSKYPHYIAPTYNYSNPYDQELLNIIEKNKPNFVIINIGGNIQEKLGLWLKNNSSYSFNIICTGAAVSFLTKSQAPINNFIDKYYIGWFTRCIYDPKTFILRYIKAFKFIYFFLKNHKSIKIFYEN